MDQNHDFNPGIDSRGLFWTVAVPERLTSIDLENGTARFHANNMAIPDYHDFPNSIGVRTPPIATIPSFVSFDMRWKAKPDAKLTRLTDTTNHFRGRFLDSNATITWSAKQPSTGFTFKSAPANTSKTISGVIGHERNGKFFSSSGED
jgi:hypothetical protein